ncbi:MAG: ABC transporter permease [Bacteroidaceae bacterium]|nr:ABC transporter permease [Bacteroidaceae bacterium]
MKQANSLIWRLLRQHISIGQLVGFFLANLIGMLIVLLSLQFYNDLVPAFSQEDGFLKNTYIIVSKRVSTVSMFDNNSSVFSNDEIDDIRQQSFTNSIGEFTASKYRIYASLSLSGAARMGTDMFFESVPDEFVDIDLDKWKFEEGDEEVPIILPRSYLALYNFGFAQSASLPKLTEGFISMVQMDLRLRGESERIELKGRIVGFSTRLNTILAPASFIRWSNQRLAPSSSTLPTRLIVEVKNPTDDNIARYMYDHDYELEDDKLDAGRTTYFLRIVAGIIIAVGLLISALSFYILMLSIFLLVQKNANKLENLLLIGYSPARVARPYQLLTISLNAAVLILAFALLMWLRSYYMTMLQQMFPDMEAGSLMPAIIVGLSLFVVVSLFNIFAVRGKVQNIWDRKD